MFGPNMRKGFTFTWTLDNFSYCWQKNGECIDSPTFVVNELQKARFYLSLYPRGLTNENKIELFLNKSDGPDVFRNCELAFLAKDSSVLKSMNFKDSEVVGPTYWYAERKDVSIVNRSAYLPEDKLTLRCRIWKSEGEMAADVQCCARTQICIEKNSFLWNIQNYNSLLLGKKYTYQMNSVVNNELLMTMDLFSKNLYTNEDTMTIQLVVENEKIKYLVCCITPANDFDCTMKGVQNEIWFCENKAPKLFTLPFSCNDPKVRKWLPNDALTLQCVCTFSTGKIIEEIESENRDCDRFHTSDLDNHCLPERNMLPASDHALNKNLKSLFRDIILSDIKLQSNTKAYFAHKSLLNARSLVLKALFESDLKRNINTNDTVDRMIQYVYTAEIKDLQCEKACNLYRAADKHQVPALKEECSAFLKANLCTENACEVLILADLHQDEELKAVAQDFILNNNVINSEEWKELMRSHAKLAADTMYLQIQGKTKIGACNTVVSSETTVNFNPPTEASIMMNGGVLNSIGTRHQCITCRKECETKSPEELRAENYTVNHKGQSTASVGRFGTPAQQTSISDAPATATAPCSHFTFGGTTQSRPFGGVSAASNSPSCFFTFKDQSKSIATINGTNDGFNFTTLTGTPIKFNSPTATDTMMKGGVSTTVGTNLQCITCMKEYENKSLEELRLGDYAANRKAGGAAGVGLFEAPAQKTSIFDAPAASTPSLLDFTFGGTTASQSFGGAPAASNWPSSFFTFKDQSKPIGTTTEATGAFNTTVPTGTTVKFNPPTGWDLMMRGGISSAVNIRQQCITCMKEYENKSLEELRVEDYVANRKGGSTAGVREFEAPAQQTSISEAPAASTPPCSHFTFGGTTHSEPSSTTGTTTPAPTGTTVKFNPPIGWDLMMRGGISSAVNIRQQCITCMNEYENKSLEELRFEDYVAKRKGGSTADMMRIGTPAQQTSISEAPAASTPSLLDFTFGATTESQPFGGAPAASTPSLLDFAFGGTTESQPFGGAPAASTPSLLDFAFGGTTDSKPFGTTGTTNTFNTTAPTGTTVKFNPPTGRDMMMKGCISSAVNTKLQCISCMKEYENKSLEEVRLGDYAANRKGGSTAGVKEFEAPAQQTSISDTPAASTPPCSDFTFGGITHSESSSTTGTTNLPDNNLAPVLSELGSTHTNIPSPLPECHSNSEKTVAASSELNSSNSIVPSALPQFSSNLFPLGPTIKSEKTSVALSLSLCFNSNKTPDKPSFSFCFKSDKTTDKLSFSFGNESEKTALPAIINSSNEQTSSIVPGIESSSTAVHPTPNVLNNSDAKAPPPLSVEFKSTNGDTLTVSSEIDGTRIPNTEIVCSTTENTSPSLSADFNSTKESTHFKSSALVSSSATTPASIGFNNIIPMKQSDTSILDIGKLKLSEFSEFDSCSATSASATLVLDSTCATALPTHFGDNSNGSTPSTSSGLDGSSAEAISSRNDTAGA